jgi:nickel/cobalt transporter (NicO) family protein
MLRVLRFILTATGILTLLPSPVWAHLVNTAVAPFYAGMLHPVMSNEHLLPMLALALVISQGSKATGYGALLLFPATLVLGTLGGSSIAALESVFRVANHAILAVLGGLLLATVRKSLPLVATAVILTGLILGFRSGIDWQGSGVGYPFVPGIALTGLVVMALFAGGFPKTAGGFTRTARILCGLFFTVIGLAMLSGYWTTGDGQMIRGVGLPTEADLTAMVRRGLLSPALFMGAIFGAGIWGAGHALTPGHGKAIVGAYLIGARSTGWHAVYLGLTVTITHTLGVFILGLVALFASRYMSPDQLYPWLGAVSGIIVFLLGAVMVHRRLLLPLKAKKAGGDLDHTAAHALHTHAHHPATHDHPHFHPTGENDSRVTWRTLIGLGVSGGLLPCPSALVLLLSAVSIQRIGFGMILVLAFSLGLAGVLTTVGLLFVKGRHMIRQTPVATTLGRHVPAVSAIIIMIIGMVITGNAIAQILS